MVCSVQSGSVQSSQGLFSPVRVCSVQSVVFSGDGQSSQVLFSPECGDAPAKASVSSRTPPGREVGLILSRRGATLNIEVVQAFNHIANR